MSIFGDSIAFLDQLGVYDVLLPFLLVFTLMYAFLEKTKIFGIETYYIDAEKTRSVQAPRRNLNAMAAFVTAFFVVASTQLVAVINTALSHMVLLLLLVFCFILVVGAFSKEGDEGFFLDKGWATGFKVLSVVVIILIFFNALGWLDYLYGFFLSVKDSAASAALVLVLVMAGLIFLITKEPKASDKEKEE